MRKMMVPLALLALLIWIIGGSWWYSQQYNPARVASPANGEALDSSSHLSISHSTFDTDAPEALAFKFSEAELQVTANTHRLIRELIAQLQKVDQMLSLTGLYLTTEEYDGGFDNLGLARAAFVKQLMVRLGAKPNSIEIGGRTVPQLLQREGTLLNAVQFELKETKSIAEEANSAPSGWIDLTRPLNFQFRSEPYELKMNQQLRQYISSIRQLMEENPQAIVRLTGFNRRSKDQASTAKRTKAVQDFFLRQGFDKKRLLVQFDRESLADRANTSNSDQDVRRVEVRVQNRE